MTSLKLGRRHDLHRTDNHVNDTDEGQRRAQVAQIAELRSAGRSIRAIAEELGIPRSTVSRLAQTGRDTLNEQRDTPDQPQYTGPTTAAGHTPAALRAQAEQLRRRADQARRDVPLIMAEAQARSQALAGQAVTDDRAAEALCRMALDLERPPLPPGVRIFGRVAQ